MPYMQVDENGGVGVYKEGADGKPTGKRLGFHKEKTMGLSHKKAGGQIAAIMDNEKHMGSKALDELALGAKYMDDMPLMMPMKLEPSDPRVQYGPLLGTDTQACANCSWFCAHNATCNLVYDDIVATGKCNLWLGEPPKTDMMTQNPIPVVIVDMPVETGSAEFAVDANDNHPDKLPINDKGQIEGAITSVMTGSYRGNKITPALTPEEKSKAKTRIRKAINASGEGQDWKDQELARLEGKELAQKESPILTWLKNTFGKKSHEELPESGFKSLPGNKWVSFYSNSFADKSGEIFTEAATDQYIEFLDKGLIPYPDLLYWHILGTKHGQAEWIGREGHINVAAGSFDDSEMANLFRKEYEREPYRTSHTYGNPVGGKNADGQFVAYFDVELSPLPVGKEANEWTPFLDIKEMKQMPITPEKRAKLEAILGKELAAQTLDTASKMSAELEAVGLKWKEAENLPAVDADAREAIQAVATANKEAIELSQKAVTDALTAIQTGIKAIQDGETARNERLTKLETFVKEQFADAPRATTSAQTVVPKTDPQAAALAAKAADPTATTPNPSATPGETVAGLILNFAPKGQ